MGAIGPLIGFGVGFIGFGFFYALFEDILSRHLQFMILSNVYYDASALIWDALPFISIIIGVLCLVGAGIISRGTKTVVQE